MHRSYFRKLITARVVQFPFVPHSYGHDHERFRNVFLGKGQQHIDFVDHMAAVPIPKDNMKLSEEDKVNIHFRKSCFNIYIYIYKISSSSF